jgi:Pyridoxamine 5'-phosphate oxidase
VHETPADLAALQDLLDRSYAAAGPHLLRIHTPERRMTAEQLAERLPLVGPVDGIFFRGAFHFGSSADSVRFRHIRARPHVSATHLPGEELAVTVHGRAELVDTGPGSGLRQVLLDIYTPRYGAEWEEFLDSGPLYARIDAERMFTFRA